MPLTASAPPSSSALRVDIRRARNVDETTTLLTSAVPVDAQNAPTRDLETTEQFPQRQQRSSSVRKAQTPTEESRSVNRVLGFHTKAGHYVRLRGPAEAGHYVRLIRPRVQINRAGVPHWTPGA